jgi:hypothetical protein
MQTAIAPLRAISEREERFAQHLAVFDDPAAAYLASGVCSSTNRAYIRTMAYALKGRPHVAARITALRNEIAAVGPQATQAALVADLQEALAVDVAEIVRLDVVHCPHCYSSPAYATAWPILAAQCLDSGSTDFPPQPLTVDQFDPEREPWLSCALCLGAGRQLVRATPTDKLSAPARRLVRGYETHSDGSIKKLLLVDQTQLRTELHRTVPGFYTPARSVSLTATVDATKAFEQMSEAEMLAFLATLPTPKAAEPAVIDVTPERPT